MVEEERGSTSSELRHSTEGEVDDEHVATISRAGATMEAQSDEVDALEDMVGPMTRVGPGKEIEEAGGSTSAKLRSGEEAGPHGSTLAEGSGASAGVQAAESEESETVSEDSETEKRVYKGEWRYDEVKVAHEVITVEVDGEDTRRYSIDEFGRILQTSQWSLVHRIEVCKVLECNVYNPWMMTPLSRQEYAKQSLALVDRPHGINVNDIRVSDFPSLEEMSLLVKKEFDVKLEKDIRSVDSSFVRKSERSIWQKHFLKLRRDVMGHVFRDWKNLRKLLDEELEILREKDKLEEWYKRAFAGKDERWQPWQIYNAIQYGDVDTVHEMMAEIGVEQWGKLKPREYRGATPLHWAALHNLVDQRLWDLIDSDPWPDELFDDFGFKPVHMAIFASSFLPTSHERNEDISKCLEMTDGYAAILTGVRELDPGDDEKLCDIVAWDLPHKKRTHGWNFEVCPLTRSTRDGKWIDSTGTKDKWIDSADTNRMRSGCGNVNNENFFVFKLVEEKGKRSKLVKGKGQTRRRKIELTFVAKCYFSTPIHPLHLAIWIGHPLVVEKLIHLFEGMRHIYLETFNGDTILHLAVKAIDFKRRFGEWEIRSRTSTPNFENRIWSEDYIAKGMNYASREQVMTMMMRYLHFFPHMLNSQNKDGQTPLHIAIFHGNLWCVRALLRCEYVNFNIKNTKEVTPIDMVLKLEYSTPQRMYANILGRNCTISEEVGFTTTKCNDVGYFGEYGRIIGHLMEALESDIVRQRRILQLSQWSDKHRIYALQMLIENPVRSESVKDTYIRQCVQKLSKHGGEGWAKNVVEQSDENGDELQILKFRFIQETSRQYGDKGFEHERRLFAAIEDGDCHEFQRLSKLDSTKRIVLRRNSIYKGANSLHWAILHGEVGILRFIAEYFGHIKSHGLPHRIMYFVDPNTYTSKTKIVDVADGFGLTCLQFASIYSFIRSDARFKPILLSDMRFNSRESEQNESIRLLHSDDHTCYEKIIVALRGMGWRTDLHQGLWRADCGDLVMWGITPPNVIHVDKNVTQTLLSPLHLANAQPYGFKKLLERTDEEAWTESNVETGDSILHNAERWEVLMRRLPKHEWGKTEFTLLKKLRNSNAVNFRNWNRETPLHRAVRTKSSKWAEVLLQLEHLQFNLRDQKMLTPGDLAAKMLEETPSDAEVKKIVELLDSYDPQSWPQKKRMEYERERDEEKKRKEKKLDAEKLIEEDRKRERDEEKKRKEKKLDAEKRIEEDRKRERDEEKKRKDDQLQHEKQIEEDRKKTEALQRERQVYVDAANAILVGGALIASASFGAWLQPPLGLHPYYSPQFLDTSAPPALGPIYESYVAIQQHWTIEMFWIFNSLSFFFSLATVIAGADAALPRELDALNIQRALDSVKRAVKIEAWLLIASILSVISTFATVGFTVLPPISKYRVNMICTLVIGIVLCIPILIKLLRKLFS